MNTAATQPPLARPPSAGIQPRDRLGFTLFLAAVLHALVILGITFDLPAPRELARSLEITLATQPSEVTPEDADYLAQFDQQGSGTLDEKATPSSPEEAVFQDSEIHEVMPVEEAAPEPTPRTEQKVVTTTSSAAPERVTSIPRELDPLDIPQTGVRFDMAQLSQEIATLEAQRDEARQLYAERPRIHRINSATTRRDPGAYYMDSWRRKIERVGNQNYPAEASRQGIHGSLILRVTIKRDGTLANVELVESSGHAVLDNAALRIVRLAAPYAPFTGDLMEFGMLEITRTWRFEPGDRISSF
ncbi:MAG: energy transducer TonB [Pseudomonas sp.]